MDDVKMEWKVITAIWLPIIWPFLIGLIVYAFGFRSIARPQRYWLISLVGGAGSMMLIVSLGGLGLNFVAIGSGMGKWGGRVVGLFIYVVPVGISVWAARTGNRQGP